MMTSVTQHATLELKEGKTTIDDLVKNPKIHADVYRKVISALAQEKKI